jgi:diguanylate cyclase (GGDEF)-like protein
MTTTLLTIALGLVSGLAAIVVFLALRTRASVESRMRKLADGLGYTSEVASSLEPSDILDRVLDATIVLPGVDAALVVISNDTAPPETRAIGLSDDELERTLLQMPTHPDLSAVEVVYRYRLDEMDEAPKLPRAALTVPLRTNREPIGSIAAITRSTSAGFSEAAAQALDGLARRAGPALANARRFSQARELAELDSLTGLHNRRLFYEFLSREIARSRRYDRHLSLIVFDLDDFKRINERIGHLGGDNVLIAVADRVRSVVRATDIPCRVGGDEFGVILTEARGDDAELLADRIARAVRAEKIEKVGALKISAGVAQLRGEESALDLFARADQALYRAKDSGKARIVVT